jgi:hypothetical protein
VVVAVYGNWRLYHVEKCDYVVENAVTGSTLTVFDHTYDDVVELFKNISGVYVTGNA